MFDTGVGDLYHCTNVLVRTRFALGRRVSLGVLVHVQLRTVDVVRKFLLRKFLQRGARNEGG